MTKLRSKPLITASMLALAVIAWMATGTYTDGGGTPQGGSIREDGAMSTRANELPAENTVSAERGLLRVSVTKSHARAVTREVVVSARTEPNRSVELRSEAEGRVVELNAERGALLRQGEQIARLDMRDREARLAEVKALIEQHQLQYDAARSLRGQELLSAVQIAEAKARLVASEAALANIELQIQQTRLYAPFDAVVQERHIEVGDFVKVGDTVAELVDTDPLVVVGEVNEGEISGLAPGDVGYARLVDNRTVEGQLRYVAPVADEGTRTFKVELAVPNPGFELRAGMTAELRLAAGETSGHLLSPALLTLDDAGTIGVKTVNDQNRVEFHPVEVLRSTLDGIWVTGLPEVIEIITVGQGFVSAGELVEPVMIGTDSK